MSKILDAVKRAEVERRQAQEPVEEGKRRSGYVQSLKEELREELRWMGTVMARWNGNPPPSSPDMPQAPSVAQGSPEAPGAPAEPAVRGQAAAEPSWDHAMALVKQQLARCEQQAMEEASAQVRLKAQVAELEQQARRVEQERVIARQRFDHAMQAAAALESVRVALSRQFEAARVCQALAQDVLAAAQEFQRNAAVVARLAQARPQAADPVAYYQQLADALQQQMAQLTSRLARAATPLSGATTQTTPPAMPS